MDSCIGCNSRCPWLFLSQGIYHVIAFTGTNTALDEHLHTNMPTGVGVPTEQVRRALLLTLQTIQNYVS